MSVLHLLKRHPFAVEAHFRFSLVLTYALPKTVLEPLLPPGLTLDGFGEFGFVAVALVQTQGLRPALLPPALGQDFFLIGYRIFARYITPEGRHLRGLRILRSDTDKAFMVLSGNLLTHYQYHLAKIRVIQTQQRLEVQVRSDVTGAADLHVIADRGGVPAHLPAGSVFENLGEARRFAGPLPYTFDYEPETHSIIRIKGVRSRWNPQPIAVQVLESSFVEGARFQGAALQGAVPQHVKPILSSAFLIEDVPYRWERGIRAPLGAAPRVASVDLVGNTAVNTAVNTVAEDE